MIEITQKTVFVYDGQNYESAGALLKGIATKNAKVSDEEFLAIMVAAVEHVASPVESACQRMKDDRTIAAAQKEAAKGFEHKEPTLPVTTIPATKTPAKKAAKKAAAKKATAKKAAKQTVKPVVSPEPEPASSVKTSTGPTEAPPLPEVPAPAPQPEAVPPIPACPVTVTVPVPTAVPSAPPLPPGA